jgi:hypothetical protein
MAEAQPEPRPSRWRRIRSDLFLSGAATVISLCALATTAWQTGIMRQQLRLSVWPRLRVDTRFITSNDAKAFRMQLENLGVGPAIVTSVRVHYRGQPFAQVRQVFDKVVQEQGASRKDFNTSSWTDLDQDTVLAQQQNLELLFVSGPRVPEIIGKLEAHLDVKIQYASIYGEIWEIGYPERSHRRVGWRDDPP